MTDVIDYKALLQKYINRVIECEGVDFVPRQPSDQFSAEEIEELCRLGDEWVGKQHS